MPVLFGIQCVCRRGWKGEYPQEQFTTVGVIPLAPPQAQDKLCLKGGGVHGVDSKNTEMQCVGPKDEESC